MQASVLIVSYRTPDLTLAAARSGLGVPDVAEVIVIDNASGDDTLSRLESIADDRLRVIRHDTNVGYGAATNVAARVSTADALLIVNSDATVTEAATSELLLELIRMRGRALVGPRLVAPNGETQRSVGLLPARADLAIRALGLHVLAYQVARGPVLRRFLHRTHIAQEHRMAETAQQTIDTTMVSGACFAIGREAFWELGGFDERFFMYFEDADLCKRATAAGMPIRYVPSAVVTHIGGASSEGDYHFSPMHARSMRQYLEKWWGSPGAALAILLLWLRLIGHALVLHPGTGKALAALRAAIRA